MDKYDHKKVEKKWQKEWEKREPNKVDEKSKLPKYYSLIEFPYLEKLILLAQNIINGLNGFLSNSLRKDWHIKRRCLLIGV
jgi:hypothetical protein